MLNRTRRVGRRSRRTPRQPRRRQQQIRCPESPEQINRLEEIRDNLHARITEAEREGWTGEAEGLKVSHAAATSKIAHADATTARRAEHVHLGI